MNDEQRIHQDSETKIGQGAGARRRDQPRRPYEKPAFHAIDLIADEVLSTGCKASTPGPFGSNCEATPCNRAGS